MNINVLDFFKFASRMPQIAQMLVLTFNIFRGGGGGGGGGAWGREEGWGRGVGGSCPQTPLEISSFFFQEQFQALIKQDIEPNTLPVSYCDPFLMLGSPGQL